MLLNLAELNRKCVHDASSTYKIKLPPVGACRMRIVFVLPREQGTGRHRMCRVLEFHGMMPGIPGTYDISSFFELARFYSVSCQPDFSRDTCFNRKHKSCRPSAYRMFNDVEPLMEGEETNEGAYMSEEEDLAAIVEDFIENGTCEQNSCQPDAYGNGDRRAVADNTENFNKNLEGLISNMSSQERDLQAKVKALLSVASVNEDNDGEYIRHLLVRQLRRAGYNATLRKVKWQSSRTIPAGEHEFADVILNSGDRIIIDTDFQSQFEIARPIPEYQTAMKLLPRIFVGRAEKLIKILQIMSEAVKFSLRSRSMHLPPWRTFRYMRAKWFSA